jgi:Spy/CpxP family protein refolding chaperone
MRTIRSLASVAALLLFTACNTETTAPTLDDDSIFLDGGALGLVAGAGGATGATAMVPPLPRELQLSDAQRAQITQLISAFQDANKVDLQALAAIHRQADAARRAGKSSEEVKSILAGGETIRARIAAAEAKLKADINAVLTPAQKEWLKSHDPKVCTANAPILTPAQQAQIRSLMQAFEQQNRADLLVVAKAMADARAAKQGGKSEAEIRAILQTAAAAQARLEEAHKALQAQIEAVLTPEQKGSGCFTRKG